MQVDEVVIPAATSFTWDDTSQNLILIVLAGHLFFNDQVAGPDQTLVVPAGQTTTLTVDGGRSRGPPRPAHGPPGPHHASGTTSWLLTMTSLGCPTKRTVTFTST
ncbi:hypothetical protein HCZ20_02435 [Limosilactobacillus fermentum]